MAITAGTWPGYPIDLGITEKINSALGGALNTFGSTFVNPNQAPIIGPESNSNLVGKTLEQANAELQKQSAGNPPPPPPVTTAPPRGVTTGGSTPPVDYSFYKGWSDENAIRGDWANTWRQKTGAGAGTAGGGLDMGQLISDMYNPAINALGEYQNWAQQNQTNQLEQAGLLKSESQSALQQLINNGQISFDNQSGMLASSERTGEAKNARDYRNALQRYQSQYGQGSSTGQALSEIILGEFVRSGGDLQQSYANGNMAIAQARRAFDDDIRNKATKIEDDFQTNIKNIHSDFMNTMAQIATRRGEIESAKTAARIDALQTAIANAQAQTKVKETRLIDLQDTKIKYEATINSSTKYLDNLISQVSADVVARKLEQGNFNLNEQGGSAAQSNPLMYSTQNGKWKDPYTGILY